MKKIIVLSAVLYLIVAGIPETRAFSLPSSGEQAGSIDIEKASRYFREAREISRADAGKLWGMELFGPMLFVDRNTRFLAANRQNGSGALQRNGNLFTGRLDDKISLANTCFNWQGEEWMMILWGSLSEDPYKRNRLIMHELWHCIQDKLGFPGTASQNQHLNEIKGRFLLKMEWRALARALASQGEKRQESAADALLFRGLRRKYFPGADSTENSFEMHEGLAEYTGQRLCGLPLEKVSKQLADKLRNAPRKLSYVNSFAYNSGAAYGILLDCIGADWREDLSPGDDLGQILITHYRIDIPEDIEAAAEKRFPVYNGEELLEEEKELEKERIARRAKYREAFVNGPVITLPNADMRLSYNPNRVYSLGENGTVYAYAIAIAGWGKLTAETGLLRSPGWDSITLSAKSMTGLGSGVVQGDGWSLELSPAWKVIESENDRDYKIVKK